MFALDDVAEAVFGGTPLGVGIAAAAVAAVVVAPRAKPLLKKAIIGYLSASERVREVLAEASEQVQDIYAEARYEFESGLKGEPGTNAKPTPEPA
jgi:hypothetical protein